MINTPTFTSVRQFSRFHLPAYVFSHYFIATFMFVVCLSGRLLNYQRFVS